MFLKNLLARPQLQRSSLKRMGLLTSVAVLTFLVLYYRARTMLPPDENVEPPAAEITLSPNEVRKTESAPAPKVYGDKTPHDTVLAVISELKATQDPLVVLNYVRWDAAFARLNSVQKKTLGINSAAGMRAYYQGYFTNPNFFLTREVAKRIQNFPAEKRQAMIDFVKSEAASSVTPPTYTRITKQLFEIKTERFENGSAEVELLITENTKAKRSTLHLVKVEERWLLSCFQIVELPFQLCN